MNPLTSRGFLAVRFAATAFLALGAPLTAKAQEADSKPRPASSSTEIAPAALILAKEIVAIGYPEEDRETLFIGTKDQAVDQMRAAIGHSLPSDDPGAVAILDDWILENTEASKTVLRKHIPDIMAGMEEAYATIFTVEELRDILTFVRTPSGQRYFELSPAITGSKRFAEAHRDLMERIDAYMAEQEASEGPADT